MCTNLADIKSKEQRSFNMSKIKGKDTKPEEYIRKLLFARGYRYRKNAKGVIGHPDIWMARYNLAIFINGCFWHRHQGCKYAYSPKSNVEFWNRKFDQNVERDQKVLKSLSEQKIRCLIIWECTVKRMKKSEGCQAEYLATITDFINSDDLYLEI